MRTYKDILFTICLVIWLLSNILTTVYFNNPLWSNIICTLLFAILTLIKLTNSRFSKWLQTPIKNVEQN